MLKFFIDIFCKDTIIGLSQFEKIRKNSIYKNKYSSLFKERKKNIYKFTDRYAYHL